MTIATTPSATSTTPEHFRITRRFKAPRALVFRAWTQAEHLARWFGPKGFDIFANDLDLRPGGRFLYGLRSPEGHEMWGKWIFRRVEAPETLEFISAFSDAQGGTTRHPMAPDWPAQMLNVVRFAEHDGQTTLTLTTTAHEATAAETAVLVAASGSMDAGWSGTFERFDAYLAELQRHLPAAPPLAPEAPDEILTTRRIAAPRALVFKAWTTPEHVARWWGPDGFTITTREMRVATGGTWRFTMHGPDGTDYANRIVFREVVAPERLVYDHDCDGEGDHRFHVTVVFDEDGTGTRLAMRARFPSAEARRHVAENFHAVEGGQQTTARLAQYVETVLSGADS